MLGNNKKWFNKKEFFAIRSLPENFFRIPEKRGRKDSAFGKFTLGMLKPTGAYYPQMARCMYKWVY